MAIAAAQIQETEIKGPVCRPFSDLFSSRTPVEQLHATAHPKHPLVLKQGAKQHI